MPRVIYYIIFKLSMKCNKNNSHQASAYYIQTKWKNWSKKEKKKTQQQQQQQ